MSFYVLSAVPNDAETVRTALTTGIERLFDETAASKSKFDEALGVQVALGCCGARNVTDWLKFPTLHERFPKETCCVDPRNCQAPDAVLLNDASIISKHYRKVLKRVLLSHTRFLYATKLFNCF